MQAPPNKTIQDVPDATQPPLLMPSTCHGHLSSQRHQLGQSKGSSDKVAQNKGISVVFGLLFRKMIDPGSASSSHKIGNAENKLNSNTASMPRSSNNESTDTSNVTKADCSELVSNGSTNSHSKPVNSNDSCKSVTLNSKSTSSPGAAAKSLKPSSSSSGPSPEHNNCL